MLRYSSATTYRSPEEFSKDSDQQERENLITSHLSKVKYLADRMAAKLPPSVERDDLYGAGVIGLIDAAERCLNGVQLSGGDGVKSIDIF